MSDATIRRALEQFEVPPQSPTFFDELWELVTAREHAAAVRWRRISLALAGVAIAAITAATVVAAPDGSSIVDSKLTCALQLQGGLPVFDVGARPESPVRGTPPYTYTYPAALTLTTGGDVFNGAKLFLAQSRMKGSLVDHSSCSDGGRAVPLAPSGLKVARIARRGYEGVDIRCVGPAKVSVHIRLVQNSKGESARGQLAVRVTRTNKPVAYVVWSPQLVTAYASPTCNTHSF